MAHLIRVLGLRVGGTTILLIGAVKGSNAFDLVSWTDQTNKKTGQ
jgi:hypothetical protein